MTHPTINLNTDEGLCGMEISYYQIDNNFSLRNYRDKNKSNAIDYVK